MSKSRGARLGGALLAALVVFAAVAPLRAGEKKFEDMFRAIAPQEIADNVFKLVGEDYTVITSGQVPTQNSMTASFGGMGILFEKPATWCFLRANRYTLEKIRENQTYTMSYFPEDYKEQVIFFGTKSGRASDKMRETKLTAVATPSGLPTYAEARLVLECRLIEVTTVGPDDFLTQEGRAFVEDGYRDAKDYHKLVFGEITKVWVKK